MGNWVGSWTYHRVVYHPRHLPEQDRRHHSRRRAAGDSVTVTAGTEVYYCYQVENTGDVTFNFHDLVDSELGDILDDFPYALAPAPFAPGDRAGHADGDSPTSAPGPPTATWLATSPTTPSPTTSRHLRHRHCLHPDR